MDRPARQIHDLFVACAVAARLGPARRKVSIHRTEVTGRRTNELAGSVLASDDRTLEVATDGGVLRIVEIQPEGKRAMAAREFLAGHPLAAGARFEQP